MSEVETVVAQETDKPVSTVAEKATTEIKASTNVDFLSLIDDGIKSQSNIKDFKDANSLAKSYLELQKMVGGSLRIPPKDASPEARQDFFNKIKDIDGILLKDDPNIYSKLGRPESADKYDIEKLVPEEFRGSLKEDIAGFKQVAFELGLSNEQALKMAEKQMEIVKGNAERNAKEKQAAEESLKKLWGQDYDNRLNAAKQVAKIYGDKFGEDIKKLVQGPAGNNPALLHMLSELAETYKEKGHEGLSSSELGITPEIARQKIMEKRKDRGFMEAYTSAKHPNHAKAVAELEALYRHL